MELLVLLQGPGEVGSRTLMPHGKGQLPISLSCLPPLSRKAQSYPTSSTREQVEGGSHLGSH